jgi:hypothetical protein
MKIIGTLFLIAVLLFLAACGRNERNESEHERPVVAQGDTSQDGSLAPTTDNTDGEWVSRIPLTPEVRPGLEGIYINWGMNPVMYGDYEMYVLFNSEDRFAPSRQRQRHGWSGAGPLGLLHTHFNVQILGVYVTDELIYDSFISPFTPDADPVLVAGGDNVPDIFLQTPQMRAQAIRMTRTIPEDMIRRYAPNYAALLDKHNGWEVSLTGNGEQMALNTFDAYHHHLDSFSIYRLEWLEELNIPLPGTGQIQRVADGVYFTPESFTHHEFLLIMDAFAREVPNPVTEFSRIPATLDFDSRNLARERTWGLAVNNQGDYLAMVAPILGMFGVNTTIMEEGGSAVPFFASQAYRAALIFLEDLAARESLFYYSRVDTAPLFQCAFFRVGWASIPTQDIYSVINGALLLDPDRRFLITPPENGGPGYRGVGLIQGTSSFNPNGKAWVIGSHVNDDTLSRILNMFDEMTFCPELFTMLTFGYYEESPFYDEIVRVNSPHFFFETLDGRRARGLTILEWSGEPYNSTAHFRRPPIFVFREGVFHTGIMDGHTFPRRLFGEYDAVARFAQSDEGMRLNIPPAREDTQNIFWEERAALDEKYWHRLMGSFDLDFGRGLVRRYLVDVLRGEINVASTWEAYIQSLNEYGLQEYIELFSRFPN